MLQEQHGLRWRRFPDIPANQLFGGGLRNKIFADAFGRDPEFFAFYRAMQAYETALIGGNTSLILSPDSEFFKFFGKIKQKSE